MDFNGALRSVLRGVCCQHLHRGERGLFVTPHFTYCGMAVRVVAAASTAIAVRRVSPIAVSSVRGSRTEGRRCPARVSVARRPAQRSQLWRGVGRRGKRRVVNGLV